VIPPPSAQGPRKGPLFFQQSASIKDEGNAMIAQLP
jgi:hypothetical protein